MAVESLIHVSPRSHLIPPLRLPKPVISTCIGDSMQGHSIRNRYNDLPTVALRNAMPTTTLGIYIKQGSGRIILESIYGSLFAPCVF